LHFNINIGVRLKSFIVIFLSIARRLFDLPLLSPPYCTVALSCTRLVIEVAMRAVSTIFAPAFRKKRTSLA
jgi:hypothetical protein